MKKIFSITAFAIAVVAMLSCSKNELNVIEEQIHSVTFSASLDDAKTIISDNTKVLWQVGDEIGISEGKGGSGVTGVKFTNSVNGANGLFTGSIAEMDNYYAAAPYSAIGWWNSTDPSAVYLNVPTEQTATKGTFDPAAGLMVGTANNADKNFTFHHVLGYIKFTIGPDSGSIKSVTLTSEVGMACCMKVSTTAAADNVKGTKEGADIFSITLSTKDGSAMEQGDYYIGLRARKYTGGITITFKNTEGKIANVSNTETQTINSATVYNIGEIKGLDFKSAQAPPEIGTVIGNGIVAYVGIDHYLLLSIKGEKLVWSTDAKIETGATSDDGAVNTKTILDRADYSAEKFPAFNWAASLGDGWHLASKAEMTYIAPSILGTKDKLESFNKLMTDAGGDAFTCDTFCWTSTEASASNAHAFRITSGTGVVDYSNYKKTSARAIRAVKKVNL